MANPLFGDSKILTVDVSPSFFFFSFSVARSIVNHSRRNNRSKKGGVKRKKSGSEELKEGEKENNKNNESSYKKTKKEILPSMIKNKEKRSVVHAKLKLQKKVEKRKKLKARDTAEKRALEIGEELPPRKTPRTIENTREPDDALLVIGLPDGPTAHFKLSKLVLRKDIKNHGNPTSQMPELALNNFTTGLGHGVGRLIQSLFPQNPEFRGRRVATFHNQHHRYIFETEESKVSDSKGKNANDVKSEKIAKEKVIACLQECGSRFTLKLVCLQHGTFDTKGGEFKWVHKAEMDTSRRRFFF